MEKKIQIEEVDELLMQYLSGNASEKERQHALEWINSSQGNAVYFNNLKKIYLASFITNDKNGFDINTSWDKLKTRYYLRKSGVLKLKSIKQNKNNKVFVTFMRYAAVIVITFILGGILVPDLLNRMDNENNVTYNQVIAPLGSRSMVVLSDGTRVWLNAGSKLRYPVNFLKNTRDVYLEGEAYFKVTKKLKNQFIVHTSDINVKVYGTEFNVKAYPEEKTIQTTLVNGSISIEGTDNNSTLLASPIKLKPNQVATFNKIPTPVSNDKKISNTISYDNKKIKSITPKELTKVNSITILPKVDPVLYTSWKESRWVIQGEELESLAIMLERRYDVKITIKSDLLKKYKFSGTLTDETLEQVLDIIKIIAPIQFSIDKKNVTFEENKSFVKSYDQMLINR